MPSASFELDTTEAGQYNCGSLTNLGPATVSSGTATLIGISTAGWSGWQTLFAIGTDNSSPALVSDPISLVVAPDQGPSIDNLSVSTSSGNVTLTASGVYSPDGTISSLVFYKGDLSHPISGTPTSDGEGNWTLSGISTSGFSTTAPEPLIAEATDDMGRVFDFTVNQKPIVVGAVSANSGSNLYIAGNSLTFNLSGIVDWNSSPGTITASFDLDTSGTGIYSTGSLLNLGTATVSSGSATVTVSGGLINWTGQQFVFVTLHDSSGATITDSDPILLVLSPDLAPIVGGVSATTSIGSVVPGNSSRSLLTDHTAFASNAYSGSSDLTYGTPSGTSLDFESNAWNSASYSFINTFVTLQVGTDGAIDLQVLAADDDTTLVSNSTYASWADFKASPDFDSIYWSNVESTGGSTVTSFLSALDQFNGRTFDTSKNVTLTADVYSPYGSLASVAYYAGSGTGTLLGTAYPRADGTWSLDVARSALVGVTQVTVVATDPLGVANSPLTFDIGPILMGQVTVDVGDGNGPTTTPVYINGQPVTVSVANVVDLTSGATITGVSVWRDLSGTGVYTPGMVQFLGDATLSGNTWTLPGIDPSGWAGTTTLLAMADDSTGAQGGPAFVQLAAPVAAPAKPNWSFFFDKGLKKFMRGGTIIGGTGGETFGGQNGKTVPFELTEDPKIQTNNGTTNGDWNLRITVDNPKDFHFLLFETVKYTTAADPQPDYLKIQSIYVKNGQRRLVYTDTGAAQIGYIDQGDPNGANGDFYKIQPGPPDGSNGIDISRQLPTVTPMWFSGSANKSKAPATVTYTDELYIVEGVQSSWCA